MCEGRGGGTADVARVQLRVNWRSAGHDETENTKVTAAIWPKIQETLWLTKIRRIDSKEERKKGKPLRNPKTGNDQN